MPQKEFLGPFEPSDDMQVQDPFTDAQIDSLIAETERARFADIVIAEEPTVAQWYKQYDIAPLDRLDMQAVEIRWAIAWLAMGGSITRDDVTLNGEEIFGTQEP